jgi:CubicO group peptidase (beta-lactamase class C family)
MAGDSDSAALLVAHRGVVQLERYFHGDATTTFSSHSMAKTLNALLIGIAISRGEIPSVDASASRWLTEWRNDALSGIRIRDLLTMSGGFDTPQNLDPGSRSLQAFYGSDVLELLRLAAPSAAPGVRYAYDNNHALGVILERASGRRYSQYLQERL